MNTTHAREVKLNSGKDMLREIFIFQASVRDKFRVVERENGAYCPEIGKLNIDAPKDQEHLKTMIFRVIAELIEASECLKNKCWKRSHVITDVEHMKEELADSLHFFVELCMEVGMTADDLFIYYMKKNEVNNFRIETKY